MSAGEGPVARGIGACVLDSTSISEDEKVEFQPFGGGPCGTPGADEGQPVVIACRDEAVTIETGGIYITVCRIVLITVVSGVGPLAATV